MMYVIGVLTDTSIALVCNCQKFLAKMQFSIFCCILEQPNGHLSNTQCTWIVLQGVPYSSLYGQYPDVVKQLQIIENAISGGATAVVGLVFNNTLYVANAGMSSKFIKSCYNCRMPLGTVSYKFSHGIATVTVLIPIRWLVELPSYQTIHGASETCLKSWDSQFID